MSERLLSQLAHVELITSKPEESLHFFKEILGLEETQREGQSVYLRAWGDLFHHSIKLTEGPRSAMGHAAWRAEGPEELQKLVEILQASGAGEGWHDGDSGHGPAYRFRGPGGHLVEVFWEVDWYQPPPHLKSRFRNRSQKYVPRGAAPRRLDHVGFASRNVAADRRFFVENLKFRYMEGAVFDDGRPYMSFVSTTPFSHDLGLIFDGSGMSGRINHIAFWSETREDVLRAADVFAENGVEILNGPGKHAVGENFYLYVREPGGHKIEMYTSGYMIYAPDWGPIEWKASERPESAWSSYWPDAAMRDALPPVEK